MAAILYYWTPEATANLADGQKAFFSLWERHDKIRHDLWQRTPMPKTHAVTPPNVPDYGQSKASMWAITGPPTRRPAEQAEADEKGSSPGQTSNSNDSYRPFNSTGTDRKRIYAIGRQRCWHLIRNPFFERSHTYGFSDLGRRDPPEERRSGERAKILGAYEIRGCVLTVSGDGSTSYLNCLVKGDSRYPDKFKEDWFMSPKLCYVQSFQREMPLPATRNGTTRCPATSRSSECRVFSTCCRCLAFVLPCRWCSQSGPESPMIQGCGTPMSSLS